MQEPSIASDRAHKTPLVLDLCCSGGGASQGIKEAGFDVIGVEYDPIIATIHEANHGNTICSDFRLLNPKEFRQAGVEGIWISPPCQSHSRRRSRTLEDRSDKNLTVDFIPWLHIIEPRFLVVENVVGYERSTGIQQLATALQQLNYVWHVYCPKVTFQKGWLHPNNWEGNVHWAGKPLNSKDFGVAQDRERVFLVATRDCPVPQLFPREQRVIGWREALRGVLYDMPHSELTNAQWRAVKERKTTEDLLIQRVAYQGLPKTRLSTEVVWTLTAHLADDGKGGSRTKLIDALFGDGETRSLDIYALAILSGFSPYYKFSGRMSVDMRVLGNCVCPAVAKAIAQQLKN